jgi:hypothetical protein
MISEDLLPDIWELEPTLWLFFPSTSKNKIKFQKYVSTQQ